MIIAETQTYELDRYTIVKRPRHDNPGWAQYLVYLGEKLIGKQFSIPSITDCQWLARQLPGEVVYAEQSAAPNGHKAKQLKNLAKARSVALSRRTRIAA